MLFSSGTLRPCCSKSLFFFKSNTDIVCSSFLICLTFAAALYSWCFDFQFSSLENRSPNYPLTQWQICFNDLLIHYMIGQVQNEVFFENGHYGNIYSQSVLEPDFNGTILQLPFAEVINVYISTGQLSALMLTLTLGQTSPAPLSGGMGPKVVLGW